MTKGLKRFFSLALTLCLCLAVLAGCSSPPPAQPTDTYKPNLNANGHDLNSILRWSYDWPTYADPGVGSTGSDMMVHTNLYSPLVWPQPDGTMKPHVAESWTVSDDGLTYTFKIRQDIKFHSGNVLTAKDVEWSMKRLLAMGEGYAYMFSDIVASCNAPDDSTFTITLKRVFAPFVSNLPRLYTLDSKLVMEHLSTAAGVTYGEFGDYGKTWLLNNDAGSGPYIMIEPQLESYIKGEKFDDWFLGWNEDAPDFFMLSNIVDPVAIRTAFANKEMEICNGALPQETFAELKNMGMSMYDQVTAALWHIMLNTQKAPTDDVNFRKALAYAFDYDTLLESIFPGNSKATGPVAPGLLGKNTELEGYSYDLAKATALLAESKYANDKSKWVVDLAWCAEVPEQEKISLMWQASLKEIGVTVNITKTPFAIMAANAENIATTPNASIVLWGPNYNEAGDVFNSRYHSKGNGSWEQMEWVKDVGLDAKIDESFTLTDDAERAAAYAEIEEYIYDMCPTIWMSIYAGKNVCQPYVEWPYAVASDAGTAGTLPAGYSTCAAEFLIHPENK